MEEVAMKALFAWIGVAVASLVALLGLQRLRRRDKPPVDVGPTTKTRGSRSLGWFGPPWG